MTQIQDLRMTVEAPTQEQADFDALKRQEPEWYLALFGTAISDFFTGRNWALPSQAVQKPEDCTSIHMGP